MTETVTYITRAFCPGCNAAIWTDPGGDSIICDCGGAEIQNDTVLRGDEVTNEATFKKQAADLLGEPIRNVTIVEGRR